MSSAISTRATKGIFCLEAPWSPDLRNRSTVLPELELLKQSCEIDFIYRDVATVSEFEYYIGEWVKRRYRSFPILNLAMHGTPSGIHIGKETVSLDHIAELIGGRRSEALVYFGSCSTLDIDRRHLKRFLRTSGVLAVCGYKADVDWLISASFELLLLESMQQNEFSGRGIRALATKTKSAARRYPDLRYHIITALDAR